MGRIKLLYYFKTVSVLTFLKIVFLIVPINCKNVANLNSTTVIIIIIIIITIIIKNIACLLDITFPSALSLASSQGTNASVIQTFK